MNTGTETIKNEQSKLETWMSLSPQLRSAFSNLSRISFPNNLVHRRVFEILSNKYGIPMETFRNIFLYAVTKTNDIHNDFLEWGEFTLTPEQMDFIFTEIFPKVHLHDNHVISYEINPEFSEWISNISLKSNPFQAYSNDFDLEV